jgi:hypothetical protein
MEGTALLRIDPRQDAIVIGFYDEAKKLLDYANARVIVSLDDAKLVKA